MLGLQTLGWIDSRLQQVFPDKQDEWFGGVSILFVGDFFQLPVQQKPLYSDKAIPPRAGNNDTYHNEIIGQNSATYTYSAPASELFCVLTLSTRGTLF
jgi:hypothetical protein